MRRLWIDNDAIHQMSHSLWTKPNSFQRCLFPDVMPREIWHAAHLRSLRLGKWAATTAGMLGALVWEERVGTGHRDNHAVGSREGRYSRNRARSVWIGGELQTRRKCRAICRFQVHIYGASPPAAATEKPLLPQKDSCRTA